MLSSFSARLPGCREPLSSPFLGDRRPLEGSAGRSTAEFALMLSKPVILSLALSIPRNFDRGFRGDPGDGLTYFLYWS
jgi:hypothetical protein